MTCQEFLMSRIFTEDFKQFTALHLTLWIDQTVLTIILGTDTD